MSISVKLEAFEGPLDLLLHLIDKNKLNIYDIPITLITDQYLEYINAMQEKDLEIMSEFLVMAATLIHIKSKMLLPKEEKQEQEAEEDPRKELVERLLEYKMYKYMSYELKDKQVDAEKVLFKQPSIPDEIKDFKEEINIDELLAGITLNQLHHIFQAVIRRQTDKIDPIRSKFGKIEREEVNLAQKLDQIMSYGRTHRTFSFARLLKEQATKMDIIVTFLAVLELMKVGNITIVQEETFGDITLTYVNDQPIPIDEIALVDESVTEV